MAIRSVRNRGLLPVENDIDPRLLQSTQAYLACLMGNRTPALQLTEAWQQFYQTYDPVIRRFAVASGAPLEDLSDCMQEIWATVILKLGGFRCDPPRARFVSWLYKLAQSKATDLLRQRTRHPTQSLTRKAATALPDPQPDPAAQWEQGHLQGVVRAMLSQLQKRVGECNYRILYMRWIEGRTMPEIAAALDLTVPQVWLRHHRTKRKVRRLIEHWNGNGRALDGNGMSNRGRRDYLRETMKGADELCVQPR